MIGGDPISAAGARNVVSAIAAVLGAAGRSAGNFGMETAGATLAAIAGTAPASAFVPRDGIEVMISDDFFAFGGIASGAASAVAAGSMLKDGERRIESGVPAEVREAYLAIVVASLRLALKDGRAGPHGSLQFSSDPVSDCVALAIGVVIDGGRAESAPPEVKIAAGATMMLQALGFCKQARIADIGVDELDRATLLFAGGIFIVFGITMQMLSEAGKNSGAERFAGAGSALHSPDPHALDIYLADDPDEFLVPLNREKIRCLS